MTDFDRYNGLKKPIWIITLDGETVVLSNGKCGWSQRKHAKAALSREIGVHECNEGILIGKFKLIEIRNG
ncbi:MAG: hypothetical protein ACRCS6_09740 [Turicibacter sp.]